MPISVPATTPSLHSSGIGITDLRGNPAFSSKARSVETAPLASPHAHQFGLGDGGAGKRDFLAVVCTVLYMADSHCQTAAKSCCTTTTKIKTWNMSVK